MEHQEGLEPPKTEVAAPRFVRFSFWCIEMERETGVEPASSVWKTEALPLDDSLIGRRERIRTSDPLLPKQVRCQAAPRAEIGASDGI